MRELYEEESAFDEDYKMEEAQLIDPADLDPSSIRSALPYILDICPEVPLPFLTGTHHDISKKKKDWLLSLIPLKVKGTIKFQGRLNQDNFSNALSNKKALLILMYNKDSGTLIAGFTQATLYFMRGTRSVPFEDSTAFLANVTNQKHFPFQRVNSFGTQHSMATYISPEYTALHFTGDSFGAQSDFLLRFGHYQVAVCHPNKNGYKIGMSTFNQNLLTMQTKKDDKHVM
jgi:hypothetical protein